MRFLLMIIVIGTVIFGVVSSTLLWVFVGACAIALLWRGQSGAALDKDVHQMGKFLRSVIGLRWRQLLLTSLICTGIAGWTVNRSDFSMIGVSGWLAALGLLLAAGFVHDRQASSQSSSSTVSDSEGVGQIHWTGFDWAATIGLTLLAFALRIYQIGATLPPFHGDEGEMGMLALLALHGPDFSSTFNPIFGTDSQPLQPFSTAFLGHPTLFHYLQAFGMLLFGETVTGLRVVSVIFGTLCAPLLYAIGRVNWGRITGLTAGWLLAVSHLHIQYSRIALNNIETVFSLILLVWLFTLINLSSRRASTNDGEHGSNGANHAQPPLLLYIVMGLVIGVGQYFYFGARLLPLLAAILLLVLWRNQQITRHQAAIAVIAAGVAYFPLGVHYLTHSQAFSDRVSGVNVFSPLGMAHALGPLATWPNDIPLLLWTQIRLNLSLFLNYGDHSAFYLADIPAFDKITVALFWLGLGLVLARANRLPELMLLAWFGLGVLLGGVLTNDAPNGPRLIVAVPAIFLIGGIFLQIVWNASARSWPNRGRWGENALLLALALGTLTLNFNTYFVQYKQMQPTFAQLEIAQEMVTDAERTTFFLLGAPNLYVDYGSIRFIARTADRHDLEEAAQLPAMLDQLPKGKNIRVFALPHRVDDLAAIEKRFPLGTKTTYKDKYGILLYATYHIAAADTPQASHSCSVALDACGVQR